MNIFSWVQFSLDLLYFCPGFRSLWHAFRDRTWQHLRVLPPCEIFYNDWKFGINLKKKNLASKSYLIFLHFELTEESIIEMHKIKKKNFKVHKKKYLILFLAKISLGYELVNKGAINNTRNTFNVFSKICVPTLI